MDKSNIIDAIIRRKSIRTFNADEPMPELLVADVQECASEAVKIRGCDPGWLQLFGKPLIQLTRNAEFAPSDETPVKLGTYGVVKGASYYALGISGPMQGDLIALGYTFERFVLMCTERGVGTCWIGGTFNKEAFRKYLALTSDQEAGAASDEVRIVSPLGFAAVKRRLLEKVMRGVSKADSRKPFVSLFRGIDGPQPELAADVAAGNILVPNLSKWELVAFALEMVRLAPSSTNSQPWRAQVSETDGLIDVRLYSEPSSGSFLAIDMGIALCHFMSVMELAGVQTDCKLRTERGRIIFDITI